MSSDIFTSSIKYGYQINCADNPVLRAIYDHRLAMLNRQNNRNLNCMMGDLDRWNFEMEFWAVLRKWYKKLYKTEIPSLVFGDEKIHIRELLSDFQVKKLEELVKMIQPKKAVEQIWGCVNAD